MIYKFIFIFVIFMALTLYSFDKDKYKPLVFESEDYLVNKDAFIKDKDSPDKWNLWSTDKDAEKKWSGGGVVLRSPTVKEDRKNPEEGAPPLHTRITGIPSGKYAVEIKKSRLLAVSFDSKNWKLQSDANLGVFEIKNGFFELWVDDKFANPGNIGPSYYDALIFTPIPVKIDKPKVNGFAKERIKEKMDRGLITANSGNGDVYLSWRILGQDPENIAFNVYKVSSNKEIKLNSKPILKTSDFLDAGPKTTGQTEYILKSIVNNKEQLEEKTTINVSLESKNYFSVKLNENIKFQKVGIGDLNGDGKYDFVIKYPEDNIDPYEAEGYWKPSPDTYKLEAYSNEGKFLWKKDLGWSIERGIWYSPYIVYDFDGDRKAEVAVKRGEGDPRGKDGRVETGNEYLSILDGMTGNEITKVDWIPRVFPGETYSYNHSSRNQLCIAYLDGKTPCIIVERGTYNGIRLDAYQFQNKKLAKLWEWYNRDEEGWLNYKAQGAHTMHAADVDGDGRDEIIVGSCVVDDNGNGLWSTGLGHPDCTFIGDLDPTRPGLEIFFGIEPPLKSNGLCMVDAKTGKIIWGLNETTGHVGTNWMCSDIDPNYPGAECHATDIDKNRKGVKSWLFSAQGKFLSSNDKKLSLSLSCYWDEDLYREILNKGKIIDYPENPKTEGYHGTVIAIADIFGDWREEIITSVNGELRIYTTNIPAKDRRISFMEDSIYRIDVAVAAQAYYCTPTMTVLPSSEKKK